MAVVWLRTLYARRFEQFRGFHGTAHRYDQVPITEPVMVPSATAAQAPVVVRIRPYRYTLQIRLHGEKLYRPVLDAFNLAEATLGQIADADPRGLSVGTAHHWEDDHYHGDDFTPLWRDHPGVIDDDLIPQENRWRLASLGPPTSPPFWHLAEERSEQALATASRTLEGWLLVDGRLHMPTASPGFIVMVTGGSLLVQQWMPGLTHRDRSGIFLDASEGGRIENVCRALVRPTAEIVEHLRLPQLGTYRGGQPFADLAMVRLGLRSMRIASGTSVSELGPETALLFWQGVELIAKGDVAGAREWLARALPLFRRFPHETLRSCAHLFQGRLAVFD